MSWEDLDQSKNKTAAKERQAQAEELSKQFSICFGSPSGQLVLTHLVNTFIMESNTNLAAPNIEYEAAYRNGESGAVKYILNQVKRAQNL